MLQYLLVVLVAGGALAGEGPLPADQAADSTAVSFGPGAPHWLEAHPGFSLQSGYEGYLVPVESFPFKELIKTAGIFGVLPIVAKWVARLALKAVVLVGAAGAVLISGIVLTAGLCKYTPLCHLNFHHWDRESVRSLVSQDRIASAAQFLASAVAKYGQAPQKTDKPIVAS